MNSNMKQWIKGVLTVWFFVGILGIVALGFFWFDVSLSYRGKNLIGFTLGIYALLSIVTYFQGRKRNG